jgi:branched-chain amino acid transport system substrate-binding protein
VSAVQKAGPNLTTDALVKAMDSMSFPTDIFGSAPMTFGPKKRLGSNASRLSQLQNARWVVVSDYADPPKE